LKDAKPRPRPGASVQVDWVGWLPPAKLQAFRVYSEEFEACYMMLSVSLDEAIGLRNCGSLIKSLQMATITPPLCECLAARLEGMLCSLEAHVKRSAVVPSVAPLDPANFHGLRGQRIALKSFLLSRVLLTQRAQFLSKVTTLREIVSYLRDAYCHAVQKLVLHSSTIVMAALWEAMDSGQFDLNTCLREAVVLLKCFLRALPDDELCDFRQMVSAHWLSQAKEEVSLRAQKWREHKKCASVGGSEVALRGFGWRHS